MSGPANLLTGQAGVFRVASELMLRGINAYLPIVDVGVDLLTSTGIRIQVKTGRARRSNVIKGLVYTFHLGEIHRGAGRRYARRPKNFSSEVDYLIFWGVDEDRFWVVPSAECDNLQCLLLGVGRYASLHKTQNYHAAVYSCEDRWDFLTPAPRQESVLHLVAAG